MDWLSNMVASTIVYMQSCKICESKNTAPYHTAVPGHNINRAYDILRCQNCGTCFTSPQLSKAETEAYYDQQEVAFNGAGGNGLITEYKKDRTSYWKQLGYLSRVGEIKRVRPEAKSMLDVGCGAGIFLDCVRENGLSVYGLELSAWGQTTAKKDLGLRVLKKRLADLRKSDIPMVDVVTMYDVLEHSDDPLRDLRIVRGLLKPGGILVLNFPNIDSYIARLTQKHWNKLIPPNHTFHFSPQSARFLAKQSGMKLLEMHTNQGDPAEMATELITAGWLKAGKYFKPLGNIYERRHQPLVSKTDLGLISIRFAQKIAPKLAFTTRPFMDRLDKKQLGEGLHIILAK